MAAELQAEEVRSIADRYITSDPLPDGRVVTTNNGICAAFRSFRIFFIREVGLSPAQFDTYLAKFPSFEVTKEAGARARLQRRESGMRVGRDNTPCIDGLFQDVYLRQSHVFILLLALVFMKNGNIPERLTRGVIKLLFKNKHGGDRINNFRPLTTLNTELKILTKNWPRADMRREG